MASTNGHSAQAPTLIDPRHRYDNLKLVLPPQNFPILERDFPASKPDHGESSYKGSGRLKDRRALITGGDSGIGRAIAIAMAREGAKVAINYLPDEEPDAEDLAKFLAKEGVKIVRLPGDLLDEEFCARLVKDAAEKLGGLDILVNNAGRTGIVNDDITTYTTEQWDTMFKTNVYAGFFLVRAAVPLMPAGSSILWTVSDVVANPTSGFHDYAATKAGIASLVQTLGNSLAKKGIRVNGVAPGIVYTPLLAECGITTETLKASTTSLPLPRPAQPAEIAPLYVDFADGNVSYTSGGILQCNGGSTGYAISSS